MEVQGRMEKLNLEMKQNQEEAPRREAKQSRVEAPGREVKQNQEEALNREMKTKMFQTNRNGVPCFDVVSRKTERNTVYE